MRQHHPLGERLFVDYAGETVEVVDPIIGEVRAAQIFVAALGASNLTYSEARWTQGLTDWLGCHVNAVTFFGGVTRQVGCGHRQVDRSQTQRDTRIQMNMPTTMPPGNAGDLGPGLKRSSLGTSILFGGKVIAAEMKEVADPGMGGEKTLRLAS
jgi:hypothetical protein